MKRLLSLIIGALTVVLISASCGNSVNNNDILVSVRMRDNVALRYEFTVYKSREFCVKRVVEDKKSTKLYKWFLSLFDFSKKRIIAASLQYLSCL